MITANILKIGFANTFITDLFPFEILNNMKKVGMNEQSIISLEFLKFQIRASFCFQWVLN